MGTVRELAELQRRFLHRITDPVLSPVQTKDFCSPAKQFSIYYHNHHLGLIKALSNIYPVCLRLVGEKYFHGWAKRYIEHYPSTSYSLYAYGADFSDCIRVLGLDSVPYLAEVASLEWAIHRSLLGPKNSDFDFQAFAMMTANEVTAGDLVFSLANNGQCLAFHFPVDRIWEINQDQSAEVFLDLDQEQEECNLYVWRPDWDLRIKRLSSEELLLIKCIENGLSLKEIYAEKTIENLSDGDDVASILSALTNLINIGCITGFGLKT